MSDFNLQLDLGFLTKSKKYTFFKPKFIFYATYLSEKIGYWRYIKIYRHLESHPENRIYPIFRFFENWCQDENRHGDFFSALMKSQPQFLNDWRAKLWCRFFLLSVFATMFLNDLQRKDFYAAIGLDARTYDIEVIQETNATAARVFPVILNVDHPEFFKALDTSAAANDQIAAISRSSQPAPLKLLKKLPHIATIGWQMVRLYFMKPVDATQMQAAVR
jgi:magnesium-protoporphyrin IX monomethyl ester (oxidative) cyclase